MIFSVLKKSSLPVLLLCFTTLVNKVYAQITLVDGSTADELAAHLTGEGVTTINAVLNGTCPLTARGKFTYATGDSDIGIDTGIVLTSGRVITDGFNYGIDTDVFNTASNDFSGPGDSDLDDLLESFGSSVTTNDACVLEFDFIPAGDTVKFQYVFASEEYPEYACSGFNDVFGFFISGGAYTSPENIALVPGTDIPVAINTINKAPDGMLFGDIETCNDMGDGSPFDEYYVDNIDDLEIEGFTYDGFTTVLQAIAGVSPCDTYHLKLAIADGGDGSLDSGVFLKAGSLTSTALSVKTYGGAGLEVPYTNTVRGCPPGRVVVTRSGNLSEAVTVDINIHGTAVNGVDYETIPSSVVIPAGLTETEILIDGIVLDAPVGPKTVIIDILSPYTCGGEPIILGSDTITILDSVYVKILNNDTAICPGESVDLQVETDSLVNLVWIPSSTVTDPTGSNWRNVTVTPTGSTNYVAEVTIGGGVACPPARDAVFIDVKTPPVVEIGPDRALCIGTGIPLDVSLSPPPSENPDYTYSWSPATGLSDPTILNPVASPTGTTVYTLTVNPGAIGCDGVDSVRLRVLPDDIALVNNDTVLCKGDMINITAIGDPAFTYRWTPELGVTDPTVPATTMTALESGNVTITASFPGCDDMVHSFYMEVQPVPEVHLGNDRVICSYDTIHLFAEAIPTDYPNYSYDWDPGIRVSDSTTFNPIYHSYTSDRIIAFVTTPNGCTGSDTMLITVNPGDFMIVDPVDTGVCPPAMVQLNATGADGYKWIPDYGLSDDEIGNPVAAPVSSTEYLVLGTSEAGCIDSQYVNLTVYPAAVINLPDSVTIWPGESYQIDPGTNALYFTWFPSSGLNAINISNPVAMPEVRTRYFVNATTENGCTVLDSIDVLVNTESVLDAPNAFVPGNGDNGVFKIVRRGFATLKTFAVFNRWGNKVFETTNIDEGWDGKYNGTSQPAGVYIYHIEAVTATGKPFIKTGNVTLIR